MKTNFIEEIEFFYRKYFFNKNVLVPRFETESLVRKCIEISKKYPIDTLIDVGAGSGIIGISIENNSNINDFYAIEKSKKAIDILSKNASRHNSKIKIINSDLLEFFLKNPKEFNLKGNILFAVNLPYIKQNDWVNMSIDTVNEPKMALFGGTGTGFELYKKFFKQLLDFKTTFKPKNIFIIAEIGFDQRNISEKFLYKMNIEHEFFPDLRGIERFISAKL